ncbi:hypothetical protein [Streptomyces sp. DG1A-41]|uniref:hypothetical protein n=1 Tax=Streptomyces sp. DG1A-41 TaxID=3125779 RepID=UPI0030D2A226
MPVPLYAFSREEVRTDLLRPAKNPPTGRHSGSPSSVIEGRLAFFDEAVDITVDGEPLDRPVTPFSRMPRPRA